MLIWFIYLSLAWVLPRLTTVLALHCHFLDIYGVMGFIIFKSSDYQNILDLVEVVSKKSKGLLVEMVFSKKPQIGGWRQETSSRYGEGIMRHPRLFGFYDLRISLGEIGVT